MKAWKLAPVRKQCGAQPDCWVERGSPYLELRFTDCRRPLVRCERHAGEPVGVIEAPAIPKPPKQSDAKPLRWLATQAQRRIDRLTVRGDFDARMKAAGKDD